MDFRGHQRALLALLALAAAGVAPGCGGAEREVRAGSDPARPSIVVILIDTLRADHLGCYGYERPTSPRIDAFARGGVLFEHALAQSTWTRPSTASVHTGLYPSRHGTTTGYIPLAEEHETLAELLHGQGYRTAAFGFNPHIFMSTGFDQGFEVFQSLPPESERLASARGTPIVERALMWLAEAGDERPFFLYVHLFDPHDPYDPPEPYRSRFDRGLRGRYDAWHMLAPHSSPADLSPADWSHYVDLYDGEIAYADAEVGRLLDALDLERTAVMVLADHGEEFFDHGGWSHGMPTLHEELVHVPLIVSLPPLRAQGLAGLRVTDLAQQIDIVPTVLDLLGLPERPELPGQSLLAMARGRLSEPVDGISEVDQVGSFRKAVVSGRTKYIQTWTPAPGEVLYDLARDPQELHDALAEQPEESARLRAILERHVAGAPARYALVLENRSARMLTLGGYLVSDGKRVQGNDFIDCEPEAKGGADFDGPFLHVALEREGRAREAVQFTLRTGPGDEDGFYFTPAPGETRLELYLRTSDGPLDPARVHLGAAGVHPEPADPIVLDLTAPQHYASAIRPAVPRDGAPHALHLWRTLDAAYPEVELDPEAEEALKRLGYIDER